MTREEAITLRRIIYGAYFRCSLGGFVSKARAAAACKEVERGSLARTGCCRIQQHINQSNDDNVSIDQIMQWTDDYLGLTRKEGKP